jgi:prolyl-tRNA synthetase
MTHGDDDGVIMPPRVAPAHVVLLPISRNPDDRQKSWNTSTVLPAHFDRSIYAGRELVVEIDDRDIGGARGWDWIKKGIPVRVEIGPRDMAEDAVFVGRRDNPHRDKTAMKRGRLRGSGCRTSWTTSRTTCSSGPAVQNDAHPHGG